MTGFFLNLPDFMLKYVCGTKNRNAQRNPAFPSDGPISQGLEKAGFFLRSFFLSCIQIEIILRHHFTVIALSQKKIVKTGRSVFMRADVQLGIGLNEMKPDGLNDKICVGFRSSTQSMKHFPFL
ncbi:MAG: hypothetical protein DRI57_27765 [Deltaproteobacteria bacterium]|nr:MAG: hypothetical protein DRI57_27765 [Deltaproteobacteria bacterium]